MHGTGTQKKPEENGERWGGAGRTAGVLEQNSKEKSGIVPAGLGERLVKLPDERLDQIGLTEDVLKAVKAAKTIKKH